MIKINLLKEVEAKAPPKKGGLTWTGRSGTVAQTALAEVANLRDILTKVALAIVPLIMLMGFESYNISNLNDELKSLETQAQGIAQETKGLTAEIDAVKKFQEEKAKLEVQIDTIKNLSKERLRNVKALSALQTIIPSKSWLSEVKFDESKVELKGNAIDGAVVSEFMQGLEESIYFAGVQLIKSEDAQGADGVVKSYDIQCRLENM